MAKKRKNKRNKKLGMILALEILVFFGLVAGYLWYYMNHTLNKMNKDVIAKEDIEVSDAVTDVMKNYTTIALFGCDARAKTNLNKPGAAHSDAIILVSINNETKEVKMVSVYRDCFLETATDNPSTRKITEAYLLGGPIGSIETLNKNLDLNITDYVAVDFLALTKAIDAMGGIEINVNSNELDALNHNLIEQYEVTGIYSDGLWSSGKVHVNGSQATAYARIRKVGNNDFERTQRQRAVITAMVKKALESDISTINDVINEVFPLIATNMTNKQIIEMASGMLGYKLTENTGFPLANKTPTLGNKGSVVVPADLLSNVEYLHEFLYPEDTDYKPSAEVQRISAAISNETGVYDEFSDETTTEAPTATNQGQ